MIYKMNNYQKKIKLTLENKSCEYKNGYKKIVIIIQKYTEKKKNSPFISHQNRLKGINVTP